MKDVHIRKVLPSEAGQLQQLSRQTFYEAFASQNTLENMTKYLTDKLSLPTITKELHHPFSAFYFAQHADQLIGYLKLNFENIQAENHAEKIIEIERIYVIKAHQGRQVGQYLIEFAIQKARETGAGYIWLGVWEQNQRAIRFYQKNGFVTFGYQIFMLGDDAQTDWLMRLDL